MFKFVKIMRDTRLFAYIAIVTFQVQIFLQIGTEVASGKADGTTFYKVVSFAWATFALLCLKAMYEMWRALKEATDDIKSLKQKGHLTGVTEPIRFLDESGIPFEIVGSPLSHEEIDKIKMVEHFIKNKQENKPSN